MTRRERLADWISGGALTAARYSRFCWIDAANERREALEAIEAATRNGKSGTARKINRMAREALK